jgi:hypothetical protein
MNGQIVPHPDQMIVGVVFPPIALDKNDLTNLYAQVCQRYDYGQFNLGNPGAQIVGPNGNVITVLPNMIQITESMGLTFNSSKEKAIDIIRNTFFKLVQQKIKPPIILGYGIKMVSRQPLPGDNRSAEEFVLKNLQIADSQFKLLGQEQMMGGIRLHFRRDQKEYDIKIEPWLADRSKLWVELDVQCPGGPLPTILPTVETGIENVRQFLIKDIADFLQHLRQ